MKIIVVPSIALGFFLIMLSISSGKELVDQTNIQSSFLDQDQVASFLLSKKPPKTNHQLILTMSAAVEKAMQGSHDIKIAHARISQSNQLLNITEAAFLPYLGFYSQYSRSNAPSSYLFKTIDQRLFKAGTDFNHPGLVDDYETGIHTEVNLYNGGKDRLARKIAQSTISISNIQHSVMKNKLAASVVAGYFNCLAAKDFIEIAHDSVGIAQEQLRVMKIRFDHGDVLKSDILSLQLRVAQAEENVVRAKIRLATAKANLAVVIGLEPDQVLLLVNEQKMPDLGINGYDEAVRVAVNNRPELKALKVQLESAALDIKKAGGEYLPVIKAAGKLYYNDPDMAYNSDRNNWALSLILNWDLFTGNSTKAKKNRAAAAMVELLEANKKIILQIKLEVHQATLQIVEATARQKTAVSQVMMAEESLALVKKQYQGGSSSVTRYLEAEQDFNNAKTSLTSASYDQQKAIAEIARATGILLEKMQARHRNTMEKMGP